MCVCCNTHKPFSTGARINFIRHPYVGHYGFALFSYGHYTRIYHVTITYKSRTAVQKRFETIGRGGEGRYKNSNLNIKLNFSIIFCSHHHPTHHISPPFPIEVSSDVANGGRTAGHAPLAPPPKIAVHINVFILYVC